MIRISFRQLTIIRETCRPEVGRYYIIEVTSTFKLSQLELKDCFVYKVRPQELEHFDGEELIN